MRQTGKSKTCVWRWQERFATEGIEGLLRDKTRPLRTMRLGPDVAERAVALTLADPPGEKTHWTADMMATAAGSSASAVRRIWKAHVLAPLRWRQLSQEARVDFVTWRWFGGVRATVYRLDTHLLHQRSDVQPPGLQPFSSQEPLQHPTSGKRVVEMQLVDPAHQCKIDVRDWTRYIIETATAQAEKLRLAHDGEFVLAVDHFFPPSNPALPSAPDKKSFSSVSSPISAQTQFVGGVQRFDIDGRTRWFRLRLIAEHTRRPLKELVFPLFDLVGMHVELLGQFH